MADVSGDTCWKLADRGWDDLRDRLDEFLSTAVTRIASVYGKEPAKWLELNYWPDSGRFIAYPSSDGPFGDCDERVFVQLFSDLLEAEWQRSAKSGIADEENDEFNALSQRLWNSIGESLATGKASEALIVARALHPLQVAAFNYEPGEGLFYLTDLDDAVTTEIMRQFAAYKKQYGIGE